MAKKKEVVITCNATNVKAVIEGLERGMAALAKEEEKLLNTIKQRGYAENDEKKRLKELEKAMDAMRTNVQKNREEQKKLGEVMKDLAGSKLKDLKKALQEGKAALNNMSARDPGREKLVNDLKKIQAQIDANTGALKRNQSAWGALGTTMKNLFAYAGIFAGFNLLKSKIDEAYEANKRFSDSMANVRKVSGLTMDEIGKLANNLSKIDSRTGLGGLMELSYTGAKLGFGNYGIEGLEAFAKSAVKVQNALSEDMGADSMTALSKLVEVMGLIPKMGVERAMDAAGSAIFKLASTSTATGTNIIEFTKRLMGLANVSHVTTSELLALGSASDSMGLMAEVSATAFNKVFTSIQSNYAAIEKAVGLTEGSIKSLIDKGKTMEAVVEVFDKMHGMSMEEMQNRGVFKALGSDGARLTNVMVTMANKIDMLREHLLTSNEAFEDATAVAKEYEIQMDTAQAYAERAANIWEKAFVNPEGVDVVKEFSKAWYEVSKSLTENEKLMFGVKMGLQGILLLLKGIMTILPEILAMVMSGGMWAMIANLRESEGLLASLTSWFGKLTVAQKAFFKAAGWVGLLLTVYEVGKAFYDMSHKVKESAEFMKGFNATLSDVNKEQLVATRRLEGYVKAINEAKEGTNQRRAAINNFNKAFKPYLSSLLTEKSTALDVAKAYQEVVKQMKAKIALQAKEKDIEKFVNPRMQWEADKLETFDQSRGNSPYNGVWLKGFVDDAIEKKIPLRQLAEEINKRGYKLSSEVFENAWRQRSSGNFKDIKGVDLGNRDDIFRLINGRELWMAISYASQVYSTNNAINKVNQKYKPWEEGINNLLATEEVIEPYTPTGDTGDDKGKNKKDIAERKRALKAELKEAENEAQAIIDKIGEWYTLQESVVEGAVADGEKTRKEADRYLKDLNESKHKTLSTARKSIAGKITVDDWKKLVDKVMPENASIKDYWMAYVEQELSRMMADQGAWSSELAGEIAKTDLQWIYRLLSRFNGSSDVLGIKSTASFDKIMKGAAMDEREIAKSRAATAEEVDKILLEYKYIEQAQRSFHENLVGLGIMRETYEEYVQRIKAEAKKSAASVTQDADIEGGSLGFNVPVYAKPPKSPEEQLLEQFLKHGVKPYMVNPENDEELYTWLQNLMSNYDYDEEDHTRWHTEEWVSKGFPQLEDWINDIDKYRPEIQKFYFSLIQWEDEYYEATKKNYDRDKKLQQERWDRSGTGRYYEGLDKKLSLRGRERKMTGQDDGENFAQRAGFVELAEDPEIAQYAAKVAASKMWLQQLEQEHADEQLIREAQQAEAEATMAYQEQIMAKINERISKLQEWTQPIEQFGTDVGAAMGEALANSEGMAEGMEAALRKVALAWGQTTIKIVADLMMQKLRQKMINKAMQTEEATHQATMGTIQEGGAQTRQIIEQVSGQARVQGEQATNAILETEQVTHDTTMLTEETGQAAAENSVNISRAAGKTLADLGWWGIPLVAVITALLNMLLQAALGSSNKNSKSASAATPKTKLVSGMLTYDKGNVHRYLGQDGKVYTATEDPAPKDGLVTHPIATTVQGQPALVAENGPEIVIGRETTKAIMMNEPELIKYLANYQQHGVRNGYRPYDSGTLPATVPDGSPSGDTADREALLRRLDKSDELMAQVLYYLQHPPRPKIDMYSHGGEDGLYDSMQKATKFMSRYGG